MIDSVSLTGTLRAASAPGLATPVRSPAMEGSDFSQVLSQVASSAMDSLKGGEAAAIGAVRGTMPIQDVVEAVMSAERSLQMALALRDKSVAAWQEISRMSI